MKPVERARRMYPARWEGPSILVCRKCEKKLKGSDDRPFGKLKKELKQLAKKDSVPHAVHVIATSCMKLCPKGGVAVCPPAQLAALHPMLTILWTAQDVAQLYEECRSPQRP